MAQPRTVKKSNELFLRIVSACVLIPPVVTAIYLGFPYFEIMIAICACLLVREWFALCDGKLLWVLFGIIYIGVPCYSLIHLRLDLDLGFETVLWVFTLVWSADSGAYVAGRMIGGPKLASRISPNKTWSGLCGGIFAAGIVGSIYNLVLMHENVIPLIVLSALLGLLSQGGDLLESWIKRRFDKKDSGSLIPGHGGLFDRVDGLLAAAVGAAFISIIIKGSPLTWG